MKESATILVVDDEDAARFVKVQTLRRAGFTVSECSTGLEGIAIADREHPDVVVLDVNLPDISGLEVCRRLRTGHTTLPSVQILQVSSTAITPADRVRGLEQGADVYLTEPVDSSVLVATVHSLLRVRRAEAALATALENERQARQMAEQANLAKDDFIATLSHELRTPINALMGWIWQLRHVSLSDATRDKALESLERNARMQAQLINDLLDVSRVSRGKLQLEMRLVDLKVVVAGALDLSRDALSREDLQLDEDLASVWVAGDQGRLQQIVTNLVTNAIQFTPRQGRISTTLAVDGDSAVLTVADTGTGIDPAFLPHVFDQFKQGEGGLSRKHGGLGLGLTVVKQLVDLHGGTVTVDSEGSGRGTTFTVRLPRETALPHDSAGEALLLKGVRVAYVTSAKSADTLTGILESSGASITVNPPTEDGHVKDADLILIDSGDAGSLSVRFAHALTSDAPSQTIPRSAVPSDIVRCLARMLAASKTA